MKIKKIKLKGPIISNNQKVIYDYFKMEAACPNDIESQLPENGEDVILEVNSNGGLVTMGAEMFAILKSYSGKVTVHVMGMAASAASVAIMGASKILINPTAQLMIHRASVSNVSGNSETFANAANALSSTDSAICEAYLSRVSISKEELLNLMKGETFMTADKAIELGFADGKMFEDEQKEEYDLVASLNSGMLPQAVIDKYLENHSEERQNELAKIKNQLGKTEILMSLENN